MNCPICGANTKLYFNKGKYIIYKCIGCGLGVTKNTHIQESGYHRDEVYIEEEELFRNIFEKRVDIISRLSEPGKVLEVGCSTGLLLSLLKTKGWKVKGIELSKKAAAVAKQRVLDVTIGSFEKITLKEKYDLVIFNHVLEHLENPEQVLKKTNSILKTNGMVLISLPNFNSLSARIFKSHWQLLLADEHLWHFTKESLKILLAKTGFRMVYEEYSSGIWDFQNPFLELKQSGLGVKKRFISNAITAIPTYILTKLKLGSGMIMVGRKTND